MRRRSRGLSLGSGKGTWGRRSCQVAKATPCSGLSGPLLHLPTKHSVTWARHPMFQEPRFGIEECRGMPNLKGECWRGLSHPNSGWTRGPGTLSPPPILRAPVLGAPWKSCHLRPQWWQGGRERDLVSCRGRVGWKTRKKSLTPQKGLKCARSEG